MNYQFGPSFFSGLSRSQWRRQPVACARPGSKDLRMPLHNKVSQQISSEPAAVVPQRPAQGLELRPDRITPAQRSRVAKSTPDSSSDTPLNQSAAKAPTGPAPAQPYQLKASSRALLERRRAELAARTSEETDDSHLQTKQHSQNPPKEVCFRFWHDEKRFKGTGADSLVQRTLTASGGRRTGGHLKSDPTHGPLGWQRMGSWDVLWSPASTALQAAAQGLRRHQLVCAVPGSQALSRKRRLPQTLSEVYGAAAASSITPLTFQLPAQLAEWRAWMAAHPCAAGEPQRLWMLKTSQHLGKGLQLVTQDRALDAVLRRQAVVLSYIKERQQREAREQEQQGQVRQSEPGDSQSRRSLSGRVESRRLDPNQPRPFVVAQLYVNNPLLIEGRKFGIRLWVVAVGADPLRAYLHKNGLVLFATEPYDAAAAAAAAAATAAATEGPPDDVGNSGTAFLTPGGMTAPSAGGGAEEGEDEDLDLDQEDDQGKVQQEERERVRLVQERVRAGSVSTSGTTGSSSGSELKPSLLAARPDAPLGHITNYAQNVDGEVWSLRQLGDHLGPDRFRLLYHRILRSAALTVAAAVPSIRSETARLRLPVGPEGGGCFELFGLDYLVDEELRPWLLEVNATPSLAVQHSDPRVEQLIRQQKEGMVADMVALLRLERRYGRNRNHQEQQEEQQRRRSGDSDHSTEPTHGSPHVGRGEEPAAETEHGDGDGDGGDGEDGGRLRSALQATYPEAFYNPSLLETLEAFEAELSARGSFLPLMPLFPPPASSPALPTPSAVMPTAGSETVPGLASSESSVASMSTEEAEEAGSGAAVSRCGAAAAGPSDTELPYILDETTLPEGCGAVLRWSTADRTIRAWCRDRERQLTDRSSTRDLGHRRRHVGSKAMAGRQQAGSGARSKRQEQGPGRRGE